MLDQSFERNPLEHKVLGAVTSLWNECLILSFSKPWKYVTDSAKEREWEDLKNVSLNNHGHEMTQDRWWTARW